jgi:hypothetical protein
MQKGQGKPREATYKPHACDKHARYMRGACGMCSCLARIQLVFSSYSPRVHLAFSGGAFRGNEAAQASCCFVLTAKGWPLFKRNRISISAWLRWPLAPAAAVGAYPTSLSVYFVVCPFVSSIIFFVARLAGPSRWSCTRFSVG